MTENVVPEPSPETVPTGRGGGGLPTRVLLACAAIGAAGGLIVAPVSVFSSSGPALAMPIVYSVLAMIKLLPGVLAQTMLQRPGVALLTGVIVGLINIPFSVHGPMVFVSLAAVGLLQEIGFAAFRYRRWDAWLFLVSNVAVGAVLAIIGWRAVATAATHPAIAAGYWGTAIVGAVVVTLLGLLIGSKVRRSGVVSLAAR